MVRRDISAADTSNETSCQCFGETCLTEAALAHSYNTVFSQYSTYKTLTEAGGVMEQERYWFWRSLNVGLKIT